LTEISQYLHQAQAKAPVKKAGSRIAVKRQWQQHDRRMAARAELAAAGVLPEKLNPPMEPPVARRIG
jgi:hypothetical protein